MAEDAAAKEERIRPTAESLAQALKRVKTSGWKEDRQEAPAPKPSKWEPLTKETLVKGIAKLEETTPQKVEDELIDRRRGRDVERFKDIMATTKKMEEDKRKWEEGAYERFLKRQARVPEEAKGYVPQSQIPMNVRAQAEQKPLSPAPVQQETPQPARESIFKKIWNKLRGKA